MSYRKTFSQILASIFILGIFLSISQTSQAFSAYEYSTQEKAGDIGEGGLIPCTNSCNADDIFRLINNLVEFFIKVLVIPIFVIMIVYAGYKYIIALGNPSKVANLKSLFSNMLMGLVLVLCSFIIVKGILYALGYTEGLLFFE